MSQIARIKCGEIYILSTDFFSLSCEFCQLHFNTLGKLNVHLNEHFSKSPTNIKSMDSISCDSDCELIPLDDEKYSLTDNLKDNDFSNSTVADEGSSAHTFIDNETYKNEQCQENLRKPKRKLKRKRASKVGNILRTTKPEEMQSNGFDNKGLGNTVQKPAPFEMKLKAEIQTDSDGLADTKSTEWRSISKTLFDCTVEPAKRIKTGFECTFCTKTLKSRKQRNDHENKHTGKRPYQCLICGTTFTTYSNLCVHVNSHAYYRQFECSICGKKFINNATLNFHTREKHLPDTDPRRYFPCELCDCKLKSYGQLHRHRQTHKENHDIFTCDYCRKQFTTKGSLVQHLRIHSGVKPYKCNYCHMQFRQASNKFQHERRCIYE